MKLYSEGKKYKLYEGDMLDMLDVIEPNSIDSIVTDPPYELNFMNKGWDNSGIAFQVNTWKKCFEVLKPGGYLLAFGGSRTYHRITCAIEDAGFEIRDTIMWLYGSGFPKSMSLAKGIEAKLTTGSANKTEFRNLNGEKVERGNYGYASMVYEQGGRPADYNDIADGRLDTLEPTTEEAKQWEGWGTCLKPAYEPIVVARKPCEGSCIDNVLKYGVGGINVDECRVPLEIGYEYKETTRHSRTTSVFTDDDCGFDNTTNAVASANPDGRFPANVILTYDETDQEEVIGGMPDTSSNGSVADFTRSNSGEIYGFANGGNIKSGVHFEDSGSAARYFYCAKASSKDRDEGLEDFDITPTGELQGGRAEGSAGSLRVREDGSIGVNPYAGNGSPKKNTHPTVKPCELMQYLIRLVTPKGGIILDPFNGSGSTGKAAIYENRERSADYKYIGIEITPDYLPLSNARISYIENKPVTFKLFDL